MNDILAAVMANGPMGLVAAIALIALYRKDKEVKALYVRLEDRGIKMTEKYHLLAMEITRTIRALMDTLRGTPGRKP